MVMLRLPTLHAIKSSAENLADIQSGNKLCTFLAFPSLSLDLFERLKSRPSDDVALAGAGGPR